ncbi:hypothetical protein SLS56_002546 [Neofusicoccum ribis]|uniref:Multiple myeloma tumor-associated protein 2-like N-terminal domain-containing protein n=1 Tax=Neofusicoccum ribis TaxID=45134 RepID=A0ABR3T309_9PEZI
MDLVQSIRKDGSRGSAAIGDNVDVENIRNSNHRENYLGHSILAPVGRSERRRDQLFWARNNAAIDVEDEEIKQERKEAQIRERRALNEHLGRPIDEGIEELINGPKPAQPVVANPNLVADDRPQRHRTREMSLERSRNDYIPRRDRDRDREDSFASERRPISRRGSFSHY